MEIFQLQNTQTQTNQLVFDCLQLFQSLETLWTREREREWEIGMKKTKKKIDP